MMAAKQINYSSIFGAYVMKTQYEEVERRIEKRKEIRESLQKCFLNRGNDVMQETVEDYIEQA